MKYLLISLSLIACNQLLSDCISGNCKNGYGTYQYDEETYEGRWFEGKRHGIGSLAMADGTYYAGDWINDKKHGKGVIRRGDQILQEGIWRNDYYVATESELAEIERQRKEEQEETERRRKEEQDITERKRKERAAVIEREEQLKKERERIKEEEIAMKYMKIYHACLLDKSADVDMQIQSIREAVELTCSAIALNPSWLDELRYNLSGILGR